MRTVLSVLGVIVAGAIFFIYTKPAYDVIQADQVQIAQYNAALDKATQLQQLKQTLLTRYNSFSPSDLTRLQTMLPDQVNNIGLILDLDTLANHYAMSLENVNISNDASTPSSVSTPAGAVTAVGAASQPYESLDVQFTVHGTYTQFTQYITDLETSLRVVDLVGLSIGAGGSTPGVSQGSDNIVYTFNITFRTYWLK
jgi:Tfp pilus assembly protein PilO